MITARSPHLRYPLLLLDVSQPFGGTQVLIGLAAKHRAAPSPSPASLAVVSRFGFRPSPAASAPDSPVAGKTGLALILEAYLIFRFHRREKFCEWGRDSVRGKPRPQRIKPPPMVSDGAPFLPHFARMEIRLPNRCRSSRGQTSNPPPPSIPTRPIPPRASDTTTPPPPSPLPVVAHPTRPPQAWPNGSRPFASGPTRKT